MTSFLFFVFVAAVVTVIVYHDVVCVCERERERVAGREGTNVFLTNWQFLHVNIVVCLLFQTLLYEC